MVIWRFKPTLTMSLENDIQQKEFRNEYHKATLNIIVTHNYIVGKMNDLFKDFDITRQQYNVLRILRGQYPGHASVNLIKDRMLDKMSDASRIVERLRLKQLINREDCKNDKRAVEVTITQKGLQLLDVMDKHVAKLDSVFYHLGEEETRGLNELLDKIRLAEAESKAESPEVRELIR
jgi:DNA-binding MarR family transcriptional regulator